jgi:Holliday junction resolvasome RuvABC endonuclease subunit
MTAWNKGAHLLAIDPGIKLHGWARVELTGTARVRIIAMGHDDAATVIGQMDMGVDAAAVERTYFAPKMAMAMGPILQTSEWAGVFRGHLEGRRIPVQCIRSTEWRNALLRAPCASNADIARAVKVFAIGLPKRSNEHERDAVGLSIVASWNVGNRTEGVMTCTSQR